MKNKLKIWAESNLIGLFIFNLATVLLLLLRSAGYFVPYFPLNIGLIFILSTLLAIILLKANSRIVLSLALFFWVLAMILRFLGVTVWAERSAIYTYQTLIVGIALLIIERIFKKHG